MGSGIDRKGNSSEAEEIVALPNGGSDRLGRALLHALRNAGIAVLYQDRDLKTVWARNMRAPWFAGDPSDPKSGLPPSQAERLTAARRNVIATGNPERLELSVPGEDGMRWFEIWVDADFAADGAVQGVMTTKIETTEQKRREQTLRALLREVSHRSKNLLAIIQSIASQTGRYSDTIADFLARFRGRLQSLAASQDLVTSSNWRGAALQELVAGQVGRYGSDPTRSLRFEGVNPFLNPNATLHIGLALHELAVNSVSYGALSRPDGFVDVAATLAPNGSGDSSLSLVWAETIPAGAGRRNAKRFGSVALERVVPTSLNGTAALDIAGDHLEYRLVVPHGNFETD
jgi:two-component sensor histidine kinase